MIDWFKYYKKKFERTGKAMIYILEDVRRNPFCNEDIIFKLCDWLDSDTRKRFTNIGIVNLKMTEYNSYSRYNEIRD